MATGFTAFRIILLVAFVVLTSLLTASAMMWGEYVAERTVERGSKPGGAIVGLGLGILAVMLWLTLGVLRPDLLDLAFDPSREPGNKNVAARLAVSVAVAALFSLLSYLAYQRHLKGMSKPPSDRMEEGRT
jgi:hypothetical protein